MIQQRYTAVKPQLQPYDLESSDAGCARRHDDRSSRSSDAFRWPVVVVRLFLASPLVFTGAPYWSDGDPWSSTIAMDLTRKSSTSHQTSRCENGYSFLDSYGHIGELICFVTDPSPHCRSLEAEAQHEEWAMSNPNPGKSLADQVFE